MQIDLGDIVWAEAPIFQHELRAMSMSENRNKRNYLPFKWSADSWCCNGEAGTASGCIAHGCTHDCWAAAPSLCPTTYPVVFQTVIQIFLQGAPEDRIISVSSLLEAAGDTKVWGMTALHTSEVVLHRVCLCPPAFCVLFAHLLLASWSQWVGEVPLLTEAWLFFRYWYVYSCFMLTLHGLLPVPQDSLSPVFKFHHHTTTHFVTNRSLYPREISSVFISTWGEGAKEQSTVVPVIGQEAPGLNWNTDGCVWPSESTAVLHGRLNTGTGTQRCFGVSPLGIHTSVPNTPLSQTAPFLSVPQ